MQTGMDCIQRQFQSIRHAEFIEKLLQVILHGLLTDGHLFRYLLILQAARNTRDDFPLSLSERAHESATVRSKLMKDSSYGLRIEPDFPSVNLLDALLYEVS